MKLIVGLGNIGEKYERTRHNAGFMVVSELVKTKKLSSWSESKKFFGRISLNENVICLMPSTFMNESGKSVVVVSNFYKIKSGDIYIVYDDLDISLGQYKIQFDKGPKVHNGLSSVRASLGTNAFWHVRVGVENRSVKGNGGIPGIEYSLQNFNSDEKLKLDDVIVTIMKELDWTSR